jgi:hypothetical protein
MKGREIRSLLPGRRIVGISPITGEPFSCEWGHAGEFKYTRGALHETGTYWVEEDVLFAQFEKRYDRLPMGASVFRNPTGTKEDQNEYFMLMDIGVIAPFSIVDGGAAFSPPKVQAGFPGEAVGSALAAPFSVGKLEL